MDGAFRTLLRGQPTIDAFVSGRVYVSAAPPKPVYPYILISLMNSDEWNALDGSGDTRTVTYDVDCKSKSSRECERLMKAVRDFVGDYVGTAGDERIDAVRIGGESADAESPTDGSENPIHVRTLDVEVDYRPA